MTDAPATTNDPAGDEPAAQLVEDPDGAYPYGDDTAQEVQG